MKSPSKQVICSEIKASMNLLLNGNCSQQTFTPNHNIKQAFWIGSDKICRELEIIGWRFKTSLPIVRPVEYRLSNISQVATQLMTRQMSPSKNNNVNKSSKSFIDTSTLIQYVKDHPSIKKYQFQVVIEEIKYRLSDIGCFPLGQTIYLLKQLLIGYDVLVDAFSTFEPSDQMIAVNSCYQWRVWINKDFANNAKEQSEASIGVRQFIYKLVSIAQNHCTPSILSKVFFADVKQFTFGKQCTFVKMLQKIKQFVNVNKIFQVNKVTLPNEKAKGLEQDKVILNKNVSKNLQTNFHKPQSGIPKFQKLEFYQPQSKSSANLMSRANNMSQFIYPSNQSNLNVSGTYKPNISNIFSPQAQSNNGNNNFSSLRFIKPNTNQSNDNPNLNIELNQSYKFEGDQIFDQSPKKSLQIPLIGLQKQKTPNLVKSRLELKALVKKKALIAQPAQQQKRRPARKYSEQIGKVKSLQILKNKIAGSNIYLNDPEIKSPTVNVMKKQSQKNTIHLEANTCSKATSNHVSDRKDSNFNNSSPSTKALQNSNSVESNQNGKNCQQQHYLSLKANDLSANKLRNNQSSYYGMGGTLKPIEKNKTMAGSYSFKNQNDQAAQVEQRIENNNSNNNWANKISGLFSDNASIKHLKSSIKFKTKEQQHFEKQYLKDVKLDMLEKFGRKVRHSIVDQEDDFEPIVKNPFKSMQLIEQVFDDEGKSHIEKDQERQQIHANFVRKRNQTVQRVQARQEDNYKMAYVQRKECFSQYCSSQNSEQAFHFESQPYIINQRH